MGETPRVPLVEHDDASYGHLSASVSELFLDVLDLVMHLEVLMPSPHEHGIGLDTAAKEVPDVHVFWDVGRDEKSLKLQRLQSGQKVK